MSTRAVSRATKYAGETLNQSVDFTAALDGGTILTRNVVGTGVTISNIGGSGPNVTFRVAGGTARGRGIADVTATTNLGETLVHRIVYAIS